MLLKTKFNIFELISVSFLLTSYALFLTQSIINYIFTHSQSKDIIGEKLLYEQFSREIYANIKSFPFSRIFTQNENDNDYLNVEVKLDPYFDCQGVKKGLLNEECQDKIVNNFTCCKSECCMRSDENMVCTDYSFDLQQSHYDNDKILNYNEDELYDDPRRRYCHYFNNYIGETHSLSSISLYKQNFSFNYKQIISNENSSIFFGKENKQGYEDCGEIDTLKNHLYVKNISCPVNSIARNGNDFIFEGLPSNSLTIFVRNIISEIPPNIHEWKNEYVNTKYSYIKEKNITIKNINKFINENSSYYKKMDVSFNIDELTDYNYEYEDKVNKYQKFYWYTTNYIGFESYDELKKFNKYFDEDDETNNNLYKIRNNLNPSLGSLIIGVILIIACSLNFVFLIIALVKDKRPNKCYIIIKKSITISTEIGGIIYYIICAHAIYKSINIKMDENYMEILNLYNKRRKQKYFLSGVVIIGINLLYEIISFIIYFVKNNSNKRGEENLNTENEEVSNKLEKRSQKSKSTDDAIVYKKFNEPDIVVPSSERPVDDKEKKLNKKKKEN